MGPGVDPHLCKASEGDVTRMGGRIHTAAVVEAIDESCLISADDYAAAHDPHVWFDVSLRMNAVGRIIVGKAYGFEVMGLQGISTVTEAGARDVQDLADLISARRIPAIFIESSAAPPPGCWWSAPLRSSTAPGCSRRMRPLG